MRDIIIFSGTTEGRTLSEQLSAQSIPHRVCVASEYGMRLMSERGQARILTGRLDRNEMEGLMDENTLVIDATHPYALLASENIKNAAESKDAEYIRVLRKSEESSISYKSCHTMSDCAKALEESEGNILLTTGSKELSEYCSEVFDDVRERTYIRVLPTAESLRLCEEAGIPSKNIIAMQGPFSEGLNREIFLQYNIKNLVTKESGRAGGFFEKLYAAEELGIDTYVIGRPVKEDGVGISEALALITGKKPEEAPLSISLIGIGPGDEGFLLPAAKEAVSKAEAVFGAKRMLRGINGPCHEMYLPSDIISVLEKEKYHEVAVLYSGDTGFFSGAKNFISEIIKWRSDTDIRIIPGISSLSAFCAKLGESYDNAGLFSLHGRGSDADLMAITDHIAYNEKTFVILSDAEDVRRIASRVSDTAQGLVFHVGKDLSYDDEKIMDLSRDKALTFDLVGLLILMVKNPAPGKRPLINMLPDNAFIRNQVPMTKECIRHEAIRRLHLLEGDTVYDIGSGTGSVSIEIASLHPSLKVFAVEKDEKACNLTDQNIKKSGLLNITLRAGSAPEAFDDLPLPDAVFIGGSAGKLSEIIKELRKKAGPVKKIRVAATAVTLETTEALLRITEEYEAEDVECIQMSVSDIKTSGSYHILKAENPVMIFSFTVKGS